MIIDLSSFLDDPNELFHFEGKLEGTKIDLGGRSIIISDPIIYEGEIFKINGEKSIDIRITFSYSEACHRCLEPSNHEIKTALTGKLMEGKEELDSEDEGYDEILYYQNDILDPKDYILNQVIVSLPMKTLCSSNCQGLCPKCGADMNKKKCDCILEDIDPRLEKLKNFFPKN